MKDSSSTPKAPNTIYLKDYQAPIFVVESLELNFCLFEDYTEVRAVQVLRSTSSAKNQDLALDGEELELKSLKLDGVELSEGDYEQDAEGLTLKSVPDRFTLECVTWIKPQNNKRLEGLYKSGGMFCTQCEAEGFRRITYYQDRPDVMTKFVTRIEAEKSKYPILLSNGNLIEEGDLDEGRHYATWEDPHLKPCYLFALVAGDLYCQRDTFTRMSGKPVDLRIYVDPKNSDKCDYALDALKRSMKWDEEKYGREYDLDIFMIVAVDAFNMGAMENKGLNVFNSSCVLAKSDAATDAAYLRIEAIVAHEYFHNWSGNRVTCRDWFQLSLKEGFTVYRDSQFSADMNSAGVKRIEDVNLLRTAQFAEDAGPMSHPIRPASYMEISNFYTLTVYEKGAEVVGMLNTLLGDSLFRQGSDLYFDRHDGQAVTTEDFVAAMSDVSGRDLTQFKRWYDQGGTPVVDVSEQYLPEQEQYILTFKQSCPPTPGQAKKDAFHIPIALGLIDQNGNDLPLSVADGANTYVYELKDELDSLVFENITEKPVPSLLRGFSAPVRLNFDYTEEQLLFLMSNDSDSFNAWDAGQKLATSAIQSLILDVQNGCDLKVPDALVSAYRSVLMSPDLDKAMRCKLMMLPAESYLIEISQEADIDAIHEARMFLRKTLANELQSDLIALYKENHASSLSGDIALDFAAMSERSLKNMALSLAAEADDNAESIELALQQFQEARSMTDVNSALAILVNQASKEQANEALDQFYRKWEDDAQVMEQWFSVQSSSPSFAKLPQIKELMQHEKFNFENPNKVRSVVGVFCNQNLVNFHDLSGSGYEFLADIVIRMDDLNPQIASRLLAPMTRWRKYSKTRQDMLLTQLRRVRGKSSLSKDVGEVLEKTLP